MPIKNAPSVAALYRFPIKGLDPERVTTLHVQSDGRIAGDRVLTFRYANALEPVDQDGYDYWDKGGGLCVRDYAALTLLTLRYDEQNLTVDIKGPEGFSVAADLSAAGRRELADAVTDFARQSSDGKRLERAERLPIELIGDGINARFQDRARGFVTLHNRASLRELERAVGVQLDEVRFRSNIAVDGWEPWFEDSLIGRQIRIGDVLFDVAGPIVRCLATHANPETGVFDVPVMRTLTRVLGREKPSFGLLLLPAGPALESKRELALGDEVAVVGGVQAVAPTKPRVLSDP